MTSFNPPRAAEIRANEDLDPTTETELTAQGGHNAESSGDSFDVSHSRKARDLGEIAIVGQSGRYAGAENLNEYWRNLAAGRNTVVEIPPSRWDVSQYFDSQPGVDGKTYSKWLGALSDIDCFDPAFFNIAPAEAEMMDPQHRLFLQEAYRAFEDAGYTRTSLSNRSCGVYLGIMHNEYGLMLQKALGDRAVSMLTSSSFSIGAARIAYYLNLKGPALSIDTACSSSLVALHVGCQALRSGEIDMALVGGVTLYLMAETYVGMSKAGMLSPEGQCKPFDHRADGMVPGEGVGALVLKRLSDAEAANDIIYGVILASAMNQDGKTNGITAPNLESQTELVRRLYRERGIHPDSIDYVEMHGTGTKMGDPIELRALSIAYREQTMRKGFCAIGSVKGNIGHASAAAGLAGVQKVLLSLQHNCLPPSINFVAPNPLFDFSNSPFFVNVEAKRWVTGDSSGGTAKLRRAAVSSFGMSGTNVHIVIEEYRHPAASLAPVCDEVAIVLSARTDEQLRMRAKQLLEAAEQNQWHDADLPSIAYTLQVGRDAMDVRFAFIAASLAEFCDVLRRFAGSAADGEMDKCACYGSAKKHKDFIGTFARNEDFKEIVAKWLRRRKYRELINLWVRGLSIQWQRLYGEWRPRRISLPTYPFAQESYWIVAKPVDSSLTTQAVILHPLIHKNTSSLSQQRFSSTFSGREFFFSDHVVAGQLILPGAAQLEMARVAIEHATRDELHGKSTYIQLKDIVWPRPVVLCDNGMSIHIDLQYDDGEEIGVEIYSDAAVIDANGEEAVVRMVHFQCTGLQLQRDEGVSLDVQSIEQRCAKQIVDARECYLFFSEAGIEYGSAFRGIEYIHIGDAELVAKIVLPKQLEVDSQKYELHPALLDSALQSICGMVRTALPFEAGALKPALLFAVQSVDVLHGCSATMWAWTRFDSSKGSTRKYDIDLCDQQGTVCVQLRGITMRELTSIAQKRTVASLSAGTSASELMGTMTLMPIWDSEGVAAVGVRWPAIDDSLALIGGTDEQRQVLEKHYPRLRSLRFGADDDVAAIASAILACGTVDHLIWLASPSRAHNVTDETMVEDQRNGVISCFRLLKALEQLGYGERSLGLTVVTFNSQGIHTLETIEPTHAGIHGLIGSIAKENRQWRVRLVDLDASEPDSLEKMLLLPADIHGNAAVYRGGEWFRQRLMPCDLSPAVEPQFRQGGVYVIVGGAGALGEVFSDYLLRRYQAQLIWLGRREVDAAIQTKLTRLSALGPVPLYIQADATNRNALEDAYRSIKASFGNVHGVIHAGMLMSGSELARMDEQRFVSGFSAKATVSVRIAQVFGQASLDCLLFFSSIQSFEKTPRQSNYAAGCVFVDAYALRLAREWQQCRVKVINWGYWGSVGEVAGAKSFQDWMMQAGFGSVEPAAGIDALEQLLSASLPQLVLVRTTRPHAMIGVAFADERASIATNYARFNSEDLRLPVSSFDTDSRDYSEILNAQRELEQFLVGLLAAQLHALGLSEEVIANAEEWRITLGVTAAYRSWLEESLRILTAYGYLSSVDNRYVASEKFAESKTAWERWAQQQQMWVSDAQLAAQVKLVDSAARALPEILTGKRLATDFLFPNSSLQLVEGIYKNNPIADEFNAMLANSVIAFLQAQLALNPDAQLRILEIGAGTGGTTEAVLDRLQEYSQNIGEYCFTDLSQLFLRNASERYGALHPYLTTAIFDIEQSLVQQSIALGSYDLVIAANVLHATSNIRLTLRNAKAALKNNGKLLLNEIANASVFTHLTFGLLDGWWKHTDRELRIPGCPGIAPNSWQRLLIAEGFHSVAFPTESIHNLGQQIIVASSNGFIRQQPNTSLKRVEQKPNEKPPELRRRDNRTKAQSIDLPSSDVALDRSAEELVRNTVVEKLSESLKLAGGNIDSNDSFADFGLDSIMGVRTAEAISEALAIKLTTTSLFDYPTVNKLTAFIVSEYASSIAGKIVQRNKTEAREQLLPDFGTQSRSPVHTRRTKSASLNNAAAVAYRENGEPKEAAAKNDAIAIIGMSGKYATANSANELWNALARGIDLTEEISRWRVPEAIAELSTTDRKRRGGFLNDIDKFDPLFFNISGIEATYMDPQQRLFLEESWKALEDAGYAGLDSQGRRCGVYAGFNAGDYLQLFDKALLPPQALWGGAPSILSARIAYHLDLHGPAITIDTACSSSLVAIHLASQSLWNRETDLALAGGVFVQCTSTFYSMAERAGMLSPNGRCFTFDERADGFVPGEGVGVIVLKRLEDALIDGDHMYGVIRGSGINQDGTTNGITAPSALSQQRLETQVYERFGIHAADIQMVEAHGTGTKLGDPIEYQALTKAFREQTEKRQYCAIGSIKTNIGHTTAASGVAGVIKILLSLQHSQMPPSLHFERGNSQIDFDNSPFFVNTALRQWTVEPGKRRCAAVSSFGMSGTNAHIVIEESPQVLRQRIRRPGYVILISARTVEQLRRQVEQLTTHLLNHGAESELHCADLSYTLLMGRRQFNHRISCVVRDAAELIALLQTWLEKGKVSRLFVAEVNENEVREQTALKRFGNDCIEKCANAEDANAYIENLSTVAELCARGYALRFERLFAGMNCGRISLPTYPFAKERYWIETGETTKEKSLNGTSALYSSATWLHPLVHVNRSDLSEYRFTSTFTGDEFYLTGHLINGEKVLPGVAYLEMARAAIALMSGSEELQIGIRLKNVVWFRPLVVSGSTEVHIAIHPQEGGEIAYEIFTTTGNDERLVHSEGQAFVFESEDAPIHDLGLLREQCAGLIFNAEQCYATYESMGIRYGAAHRALSSIRLGVDAGTRAILGELSLPREVATTKDVYVLHPGLMDSGLQASVGFLLEAIAASGAQSLSPPLPFALEEMEVFGVIAAHSYVYLRETSARGAGVQKIDVDFCDDHGNVSVRLRGLSARFLVRGLGVENVASSHSSKLLNAGTSPAMQTVTLVPTWKKWTLEDACESWPLTAESVTLIGGTAEQRGMLANHYPQLCVIELSAEDTVESIEQHLQSVDRIDHIVWIAPETVSSELTGDTVIDEQQAGVVSYFHLLKALLRLGFDNRNLGLTIITVRALNVLEAEHIDPTHAGVHGLAGSLAKEYEQWRVRAVDLDEALEWPLLSLLRLPADVLGNTYAYRSGEWFRQGLLPCDLPSSVEPQFRNAGVYVVIGGAGGIGEAFSEYLIKRYRAQMVWIGRRELDSDIQTKIDRLSKLGPAPHYICADAANRQALDYAREVIQTAHGQIHGVVHAAFVLADRSIGKMNAGDLTRSLSSKLDTAVRMAQAFKVAVPDFVLFFSSVQAFGRSPGQSNYAAGCVFTDAFAHRLGQEWPCPVKVINWGYWGSVGAATSPQYRERMLKLGLGSIEPAEGMDAIERLMWSKVTQHVFVKTSTPEILTATGPSIATKAAFHSANLAPTATRGTNALDGPVVPDAHSASNYDDVQLSELAAAYIKKTVGRVLQIAPHQISASENFEKYGIDSLLVVRLTNALRESFPNISNTLFFEYPTIIAVADYLLTSDRSTLAKLVGSKSIEPNALAEAPLRSVTLLRPDSATSARHIASHLKNNFHSAPALTMDADNAPAFRVQDVAIVGLAGRFPQAGNIQAFWENLKAGKNCISEVPKERWDWRNFFSEEKGNEKFIYSKWGGFLDEIDKFDPLFFRISPREAQRMDPQERLFLQEAYACIEDAGYTPATLSANRKVGVFVGVMNGAYQKFTAYWSIANRVSYLFDFQGPSLAVDTACSSSLTAIHLALESIYTGSCECAIAGGVNLIVDPIQYQALSSMTMLTSGDKCRAFGEHADGFVDGEGVGAVVLKPLRQAIAAGDHIYGVLKGSMVNSGGRTHGYSVPNPNSQAQVIADAMRRAQIDPRTVSYIEAHGTGTSLGDPIEVAGLCKAFQKPANDRQFCAIGSVKSNIGHLEAAAGIAALTKVLLQMRHATLVPTLHAQRSNPSIDFVSTPFKLQQELSEWQRPLITANGSTKEYPLIAGISSFGAGGANAHLLVQEYVAVASSPSGASGDGRENLIVLSAATPESLHNRVEQLRLVLCDQRFNDTDLKNVAYTLQVGREAMEHRLAFTAVTVDELQNKITAFLASTTNKGSVAEWFQGEATKNKEALAALNTDDDTLQLAIGWLEKGKQLKLLDLWTKGLSLDWAKLHEGLRNEGESKPQRVSLPTYPFARERCWLETQDDDSQTCAGSFVHPLVQRNTSTLSRQHFSTTFAGNEFFLTDHLVRGRKVLPSAAYIEMVRAAVVASLDHAAADRCVEIRDIAWSHPIVVSRPAEVHIELQAPHSEVIEFEIYTKQDGATDRVVHAQGRARLVKRSEPQPIAIVALQDLCHRSIACEEFYGTFDKLGINYGPAHRALTLAKVGEDAGQPFVLAQLKLPDHLSATESDYVLHPSLVDGALQASIALSLVNVNPASQSLRVPFALDELQIFDRCSRDAWVIVRPSIADAFGRQDAYKVNIDLCDESGRVCAQLKGFTSRELGGTVELTNEQAEESATLLFALRWEARPLELSARAIQREFIEQCVVLASCYEDRVSKLQQRLPTIQWISLPRHGADRESSIDETVAISVSIFERVQSLLRGKPKKPLLFQMIVSDEERSEGIAAVAEHAISALLKTARQENPLFIGQRIVLPNEASAAELAYAIERSADAASRNDQDIKYDGAQRFVLGFKELNAPSVDNVATTTSTQLTMPWRGGGVYLITGGAGQIGLILAEEIAKRTSGARIILAGRSILSEAKQALVVELNSDTASSVEYRVLDVTDNNATAASIHAIVEQYGALDGVLHIAGIIEDQFIIEKTGAQFATVLAPKVKGIVNLDLATQHLALDFFIAFSSLSGAFGNVGQSDYALANAFMDGYIGYRTRQVAAGQRFGKSLTINWPLWLEGGMRIDEITQATMHRYGLNALHTSAAIEAFYRAWQSEATQVVVIAGNRERIIDRLMATIGVGVEEVKVQSNRNSGSDSDDTGLRAKAVQYLRTTLAGTLKLAAHRIDPNSEFERYGMDSVMALKLVQELEGIFGALPKTLLFEYQSIGALAEYFLENYYDALRVKFASTDREDQSVATAERITAITPRAAFVARRDVTNAVRIQEDRSLDGVHAQDAFDIAIIGVSGRYPGANNLDEYWENLKAGKDCVTEIPPERWDHSRYFDTEKGKFGRTYTKWGGFIDGVDEFDPLFFNISPREARFMDPQERIFLECVYHTLEDAGYTRTSLRQPSAADLGNVGVFVGVMYEEYQLYGAQAQALGQPYTLGGSPASIANRVSYVCNFHGPSVAVDTMCSSSLTAIHFACASIRNGDCEVAIAGGVNISIHPNKYLLLGAGQFASSTGRCESFGQGGDGYVPGEGVGAVLLKPLRSAIDAGDRICGVIKATAINHGGKTNGYSVPNPRSQSQVISRALKKAQIDPRAISYVEAHGTGTSLGDPIEIAGLTQAFSQYTHDTQYCAIGSVKSNIGHLESAAGIAAVTKVLLQMRHQMLVPSLHSEILNPHIDFAHTPFKVQRELSEWQRPIATVDGKQIEQPRIAGVSSFGAGGANAHVIIEEYRPAQSPVKSLIQLRATEVQPPALIVLSATTEQQLRMQVEKLLAFIERRQNDEDGLIDIAFTLQVGREAMDCRLAFVAASFAVLKEKLAAALANDSGADGIYRGSITQGKDLSGLTADDDMQALVHTWIKRGKLEKLLEYWVSGLLVDWTLLYGPRRPKRISLPNYPFARDRYWLHAAASLAPIAISPIKDLSEDRDESACDELHPFLHRDTSTGEGQRFSSLFTGSELFFTDHVINGKKLFPSVGYLEMARAAVLRANGKSLLTGRVQLRNILWAQPAFAESVGVESTVAMHVALRSRDDSDIEYEIYSDSSGTRRIHAEGAARLSMHDARPHVDFQALAKNCSEEMTGDYCYRAFDSMDVRYGPAFRTLERVRVGDDSNGDYVLAELSLPAVAANARSNAAIPFGLHPAMFDGALQSCMGLSIRGRVPFPTQVVMPVSVEQVDIYANLPPKAIVYARRSGTQPGASFVYAIDICDQSGAVCVRLSGFAARYVVQKTTPAYATLGVNRSQGSQAAQKNAPTNTVAVMVQPQWCEVQSPASEVSPTAQENVLIVGGTLAQVSTLLARYPTAQAITNRHTERIDTVATRIAHFGEINHVIWIAPASMATSPDADAIIEEQQQGVFSCLRVIKALLQKGYEHKALGFTAVTFNGSYITGHDTHVPTHASVHGLVAVLAAEYPNWQVRMIDTDPDASIADLLVVPNDALGNVWARRGQTWYRQQLTRVEIATSSSPGFKHGGVYVIVGGAGGIGAAFSEHLIARYQAKVIWLGRRPQSDEITQDLVRLAKLGPEPLYISADATDRESLQRACVEIIDRCGPINGVIHAAFASLDKSLLNMDEQRFTQALMAKVDVCVRIAQVFANYSLDFALFMSSFQSFIKRPGQSNYAAGCVFKDAFAAYLSKQWPCTVKIINWGYWGSVGAAATDDFKNRMQKLGLESIELEDGIQAVEQLMTSPQLQVGFLKASNPLVANTLLSLNQGPTTHEARNSHEKVARISKATPLAKPSAAPRATPEITIEQRVREVVIATFAAALQLQDNQIEATKPFSYYGLDSIVGVQLSRAISKKLGIALSSTGLFAFTTVNELTGHIVAKFSDVLTKSLTDNPEQKMREEIETAAETRAKPTSSVDPSDVAADFEKPHQSLRPAATNSDELLDDGIAIIGVAGRFPQARSVEEFWELLISGKDLITEIPAERWSIDGFYEPDIAKALAEQKSYSKWGGFMPGSQAADLDFFHTDSIPHSLHGRHFMEVTWNAAESAGYSMTSLSKKHNCMVGVYVGGISGASDLSISALANNIAMYFNCRGPCFAVDTMSASSLTALHLACEGIRRGECEVAIAGGASLLDQQKFKLHSLFRSISPTPETRSYTRGDGTQLAECVGVVVLKPLAKAIAARDPIRGVIKFSQLCHLGGLDGKMIPDMEILVNTITDKMRKEHVDPSTVSYMETAGAGIRFGDQLELILFDKLLRRFTDEKQFCRIGTVKSYMGHSEAASGVSQLIKVILQLDHGLLLPLRGHENMDPEYDFRDTAFAVQRELEPWPLPARHPGKPPSKPVRRALVNSVGIGGTLANIMVEEYTNPTNAAPRTQMATPQLLVMSAVNQERLLLVAKQMLQFVNNNPQVDAANLIYTLQTGREPLHARIAILVTEPNQLKHALETCVGTLTGNAIVSSMPLWMGSKSSDGTTAREAIDPNSLHIEELGARWVTGSMVLWDLLYEIPLQKLALPGYPFAQMPSTAKV